MSSISSGSNSNSSSGSRSSASQPHHDAVIAPHEIDLAPPLLAEPGLQRHRPRGVNLRTERREHAHPPIADLVAEALDDDRAIVGHRTGGLGLVGEVGEQVLGGEIVETVALLEALDRVSSSS